MARQTPGDAGTGRTSERRTAGPVGGRATERAVRPKRIAAATGVWAGLAVAAVLLAIAREAIVTPAVGAYWAHVVGTAAVVVAILAAAAVYFGRREHTVAEVATIALLWPLATVAFEFGFGHYVIGHPWSRLFADYDVLAGRVWILVPLAMLAAPIVFGYLRSGRRDGRGG